MATTIHLHPMIVMVLQHYQTRLRGNRLDLLRDNAVLKSVKETNSVRSRNRRSDRYQFCRQPVTRFSFFLFLLQIAARQRRTEENLWRMLRLASPTYSLIKRVKGSLKKAHHRDGSGNHRHIVHHQLISCAARARPRTTNRPRSMPSKACTRRCIHSLT